ncbi:MAG TPA: DUF3108 domain-containing protein [Bryobacteraceae bacterium]|nr:DUF3108 domain-containing protein [Bryobacteraceae bacterium]
MPGSTTRLACACLALLATPPSLPQSSPASSSLAPFPTQETLSYNIEWRLIYAGSAQLRLLAERSANKPSWQSKLHIESAGLVSKLYKLDDNYTTDVDNQFCASSTELNAIERSRHRETKVIYDRARGKATYVERDLLKNSIFKTAEADIPACVSDIIGGIYKLRTLKLSPGQSAQVPLSDGKKTVSARVEAQQREQIKIKAGTFNTIRYEAFVFNGALYARKAQLLIWLTDDVRQMPVQIRARMSFPIGSITLELANEQHP